jgi:hypothetical protein
MQQLGDAVASDEPSLPGTAAVQQQQQQQQQQQRGVKDGTAHLEQAARRPGAQSAVATAHVEGRGAPAGAAAAAAAAPDELGAVWRHLKHLEKAVKVHLSQASSSSGATQQQHHASSSSSILDVLGGTSTGRRASSGASLASQDSGWGSLEQGGRSSSTVPAERARLLHGSLSVLKAEIADKAVKQVEAQLLQQRVAHLEAVLAVQGHVTAAGGSGFPSAPRASSGSSSIGGGGFSLGSIGGSMLGGTGGGAGGFSAQQRTSGGMNLEGATGVRGGGCVLACFAQPLPLSSCCCTCPANASRRVAALRTTRRNGGSDAAARTCTGGQHRRAVRAWRPAGAITHARWGPGSRVGRRQPRCAVLPSSTAQLVCAAHASVTKA